MKAKPKRRASTKAPRRTAAKARPKPGTARKKIAAIDPVELVAPVPAAASSTDTFHLKLEADCTLRETADLQFSLLVASGELLIVDGSQVQRIDTAGLQLLVALVRRQQLAGRCLEWKAASPELLRCGRRLGLIDALGLDALPDGDAP